MYTPRSTRHRTALAGAPTAASAEPAATTYSLGFWRQAAVARLSHAMSEDEDKIHATPGKAARRWSDRSNWGKPFRFATSPSQIAARGDPADPQQPGAAKGALLPPQEEAKLLRDVIQAALDSPITPSASTTPSSDSKRESQQSVASPNPDTGSQTAPAMGYLPLRAKPSPPSRYAPYQLYDLAEPGGPTHPRTAPPNTRPVATLPKGGPPAPGPLIPIHWHIPHQPGGRGAMPPPLRPLPRSLKPVPARVHETPSEETISGLSVTTPPTPATLPRPIHRQATWVRPRAPLPPQRVHSRRQMDDHLRQACCERWGQILPRLGQHSHLATAFAKSERPEDFLSLSLRKFTPSTLQTYFRHIGTFLDYLGTMGGDLESMTLAKLVDFLFSCSAGQREDRTANICGPRPMLKALSWLQRHAQIPALAPIIQNPLVLAFHASERPK